MRMLAALLTMIALAVLPAEQAAAVRADWATFAAEDQHYVRYLSLAELSSLPPRQQGEWSAVLRFAVPYASRETLLDGQVPLRLPETDLFRIDLRALLWDGHDLQRVLKKYPYDVEGRKNPLVIRGDWLVDQLSDGTRSDAYYRLLYGGQHIPKTRNEFLAFWKIDPAQNKTIAFGLIEGQSRVNKARDGARWIEHNDGVGVEHWFTRDVFEVAPGKDPLNAPDGTFTADAEEHFVLQAKVSSDGVRGVLPATLLANGQGLVVQEAPAGGAAGGLEDTSRFAGNPIIVNPGSCITCHTAGSQQPTENALRAVLEAGVELKAYDYDDQRALERFHLGGVDQELARWDVGYAAVIRELNGLTPAENASYYAAAILDYRADLGLQRAAGELAATPDEFRLALGYASLNKIDIGVRLAGLTAGRTIPRSEWEQDFQTAYAVLTTWRLK